MVQKPKGSGIVHIFYTYVHSDNTVKIAVEVLSPVTLDFWDEVSLSLF